MPQIVRTNADQRFDQHSPRIDQCALAACFGIICGVGIATAWSIAEAALIGSSCVAVIVGIWQWRRFAIGIIFVAAMLMGAWRVHIQTAYVATNTYDHMMHFQAVVIREPEIRIDQQKLVLQTRAIDGFVQAKRPLQPRFAVGDVVEVSCFLRKPEPFDGFAYDKYLQRHGIGGLCHYPGMKKIDEQHTWRYYLFTAKQWVVQRFQRSLAPPEHTLILGALFGDKRAIPSNIMDAFRKTGTSHVLVISGMHVSLLTTLIVSSLRTLQLKRSHIVIIAVAILMLYVLLTGLQSSAIRAALFGSTALLAEFVGRQRNSLRLLICIAAGMLFWNPLLLWFDIGFQLSFMATAGIIVFQPRVETWIEWMPDRFQLRATASTSIAAIIATTPISIYSFGTFSSIALIANLIVVPLMPVVMVGAITSVVVAAIYPPFAVWVSLPLYYVLHAQIWIVQQLARIQFSSIQMPPVGLSSVVCMYIVLVLWGYMIVTTDLKAQK